MTDLPTDEEIEELEQRLTDPMFAAIVPGFHSLLQGYKALKAETDNSAEVQKSHHLCERLAEEEIAKLNAELAALRRWADSMPDAGLTVDDPRYDWWIKRPRPEAQS